MNDRDGRAGTRLRLGRFGIELVVIFAGVSSGTTPSAP
jgi:hypothetical protein